MRTSCCRFQGLRRVLPVGNSLLDGCHVLLLGRRGLCHYMP
ncbi:MULTISPECIES: hypothetical protein [Leclercia]|nr:hypothetical protein [Leclercia sp.]